MLTCFQWLPIQTARREQTAGWPPGPRLLRHRQIIRTGPGRLVHPRSDWTDPAQSTACVEGENVSGKGNPLDQGENPGMVLRDTRISFPGNDRLKMQNCTGRAQRCSAAAKGCNVVHCNSGGSNTKKEGSSLEMLVKTQGSCGGQLSRSQIRPQERGRGGARVWGFITVTTGTVPRRSAQPAARLKKADWAQYPASAVVSAQPQNSQERGNTSAEQK